ncbi:hypothetical protein EGI22_02245 [Lacihabitans sp. LS3-19]|uniref:hypothetical protein n=1 Tax=Lacihabitans sp. LS3-19 TaxID=2487335 RepID=UPI0020CF5804|nr:hypothetical protein [Lacihabitans sp. LS3-19]MCP9766712.1 hypothetical protein [Lacihabitans sp. LS3-19]
MKLTTEQIEEIEKYILDWKIEYRSFYDEMLDHFIADIETQMGNGEDFYTAFNITGKKFTGKVLSRKNTEYYGIKAYEMEAVMNYSSSYSKMQKQAFLKQITSWRLIIWACISYVFYKFPQYGKYYFIGTVSIILINLLLILFLSKAKFSIKMFYPEYQLAIKERVKLLKGNMKIGSLAIAQNTLLIFIVNFNNLLNSIFNKNYLFNDLSNPFSFIVSLIMCFLSIITFQVFLKFTELKPKIQWP